MGSWKMCLVSNGLFSTSMTMGGRVITILNQAVSFVCYTFLKFIGGGSHFDWYFSNGLKPPTSFILNLLLLSTGTAAVALAALLGAMKLRDGSSNLRESNGGGGNGGGCGSLVGRPVKWSSDPNDVLGKKPGISINCQKSWIFKMLLTIPFRFRMWAWRFHDQTWLNDMNSNPSAIHESKWRNW